MVDVKTYKLDTYESSITIKPFMYAHLPIKKDVAASTAAPRKPIVFDVYDRRVSCEQVQVSGVNGYNYYKNKNYR